jgi:hypothetical protein
VLDRHVAVHVLAADDERAAGLLEAAQGDRARLTAVQRSLGMAGHNLPMDVQWLRAFLAEADREGVRAAAVQVLTGAAMSERTRAAAAKLDLHEATDVA